MKVAGAKILELLSMVAFDRNASLRDPVPFARRRVAATALGREDGAFFARRP